MHDSTRGLVLFDGVCNFCNWAVLFIVDRDPHARLVFASLQSDIGKQTLAQHGCDPNLQSVLLVENGQAYTRSSAALHICKQLRWPWPVLYYLFRFMPRSLRDAAYDYFASHRYAWFGQSDQCRIPTPELRRRMLT